MIVLKILSNAYFVDILPNLATYGSKSLSSMYLLITDYLSKKTFEEYGPI